MATKLKEVDAVIVGLGWTGGILAKELAEAGLKVVALERGAMRSTDKDYAVPNIRDELRYVVRHDLMQNTARDTLTIRNNPSQDALPMRRLGSFLPGEVVGGSAVHWSGHTWRWTDMEFKVRSLYEEQVNGEQMDAFFNSETHEDSFAEAASYAPDPEVALGPNEYLEHLRQVKQAVRVPVFASLDGSTPGGWTSFARLIEQAGGGGDDPGLAQAQRAVVQRRLRAGQMGVQVTRGAHQLISTEPGLPQRARHLIRGELSVLGLRVTPGKLADRGELAGRGVGLDPVPGAHDAD